MKIVYNIIKSLRPYFFSLREIKEDVSLDLKLPVNWDYEGLFDAEEKASFTIKVQDKKEETILISLISSATVEGYDIVFKYAKAVITFNKEKEEKSKLFSQTIEEIKTLFLSTPLDKLKEISFNKLLEKDGLRDKSSAREIKLGDQEGSGADGNK